MAANGYDRRYSSIARDVDAAIERVVAHFEDSDLALRLDVLRSLTVHAKLAYETARIKERLLVHPVSKELIECVTTQSKVYERLHKGLVVEEFSSDYDRKRNVEMQATVRWELPEGKKSKRRARASEGKPLWTKYTFSRNTDEESGETLVTYTVLAGVGVDAEMKQLVKYELASDSPYPRSFYEEDQEMDEEAESGDEEDAKSDAEEEEEEEEQSEKGDDAMEEGDDEKDPFGEQIRGFEFNDEVLDSVLEWMDAEAEELDPSDVISFFLALPVYEDDWMIDERVCSILFNAGGGSEMEEEIVSDFDDEDNDDGDHEEEGNAGFAELD